MIILADDEQHRHFEKLVFLPDRLVEDHLIGERRGHRPARIFRALQHARKDFDGMFGLRRPAEEEGMHEGAIALRRLRHFGRKERRERHRLDDRAIILEPDRTFEHEDLRHLGIIPREIDGEHAAEGMADDGGLGDAEMIEKRLGVLCQKIEGIADVGLRRFAEAELIRHHDPIALPAQEPDHIGPIGAGKALAVQKHDGFAVRRAGRRHIHIGHAQGLALDRQIEIMDGIGIIDTFKPDAEGRQVSRCGRRRIGRRGCNGKKTARMRAAARLRNMTLSF